MFGWHQEPVEPGNSAAQAPAPVPAVPVKVEAVPAIQNSTGLTMGILWAIYIYIYIELYSYKYIYIYIEI